MGCQSHSPRCLGTFRERTEHQSHTKQKPLHESFVTSNHCQVFLASIQPDACPTRDGHLHPSYRQSVKHLHTCRDELQEYDAFDEGVFFRSRFWLLMSYIVSVAAIGGSVTVLLKDYALDASVSTTWPGVAGICQVTLILGSALLFFVSRIPGDSDGSYSAYSSF